MTSTEIATGRDFAAAIRSDDQQLRLKELLPPDVDVKRFTAVVLRAVQEDPDLMNADRRSLFLACQRAASDGLIPDRREGALVMYKDKVQWQPMIGGLRKVLAKAGYDLRAEVVYENDHFDYELGDAPCITHKPPTFGTNRGKVIGAYAIATDREGNKYREVMSVAELDAVAAISRSKGGPWNGPFRTEMYRKTPAKRLFKTLPVFDERLQAIIDRDNEQFDLAPAKGPSPVAAAVQAVARNAPVHEDVADEEYDEAVVESDDPLL